MATLSPPTAGPFALGLERQQAKESEPSMNYSI